MLIFLFGTLPALSLWNLRFSLPPRWWIRCSAGTWNMQTRRRLPKHFTAILEDLTPAVSHRENENSSMCSSWQKMKKKRQQTILLALIFLATIQLSLVLVRYHATTTMIYSRARAKDRVQHNPQVLARMTALLNLRTGDGRGRSSHWMETNRALGENDSACWEFFDFLDFCDGADLDFNPLFDRPRNTPDCHLSHLARTWLLCKGYCSSDRHYRGPKKPTSHNYIADVFSNLVWFSWG